MITTRIYNPEDFQECLRRAQREGVPVQVLRMPTSIPQKGRGGTVEMRPAIMIDFVLAFPDGRFSFREVAVADSQGIVRLDTPVWKQLAVEPEPAQPEVVMLHRSGSL